MKETDYHTYHRLLMGEAISHSVLPSRIKHSSIFKQLLESGIVEKTKVGRGFCFMVSDTMNYRDFFSTTFPEKDTSISKSGNIRQFRDSKARKVATEAVFFLRGFSAIRLEDQTLDLGHYTQNFGLFAVKSPSLETKKICFVENLHPFLMAENLLGNDYVYIHKYGRIGAKSIKPFKLGEALVFVDYDFNGLDEYLRIKSVFPQAQLYIPENFETLFERFAKSLKGNKAVASAQVKSSLLPEVVKIRNLVERHHRFLEQEILFHD
ncbi:hypothetical protein OB69_04135 [Roseivirga seohaensis subsp. aquiponti]|uniref:Wadjet protein JetD C-terminal domain-containing protein n=1 Tax=Roseivirga seohaensis subsp. aquiponti TaxID=1566026 RepID=A0A0L8APA9_9BACT|nr:hypothetical protein [Roseivirga seohaensis]KOF04174.1 hypothetical protein OB69_04135 [Roseivirga seohaensis subsp. aquiponti]